jgi:hypothetical protein
MEEPSENLIQELLIEEKNTGGETIDESPQTNPVEDKKEV